MNVQSVSAAQEPRKQRKYMPYAAGTAVGTTVAGGLIGKYTAPKIDTFVKDAISKKESQYNKEITETTEYINKATEEINKQQLDIFTEDQNALKEKLKPRADLTQAEQEYDALLKRAEKGPHKNAEGIDGYHLKEGATEEQLKTALDKKNTAFAKFQEGKDGFYQEQLWNKHKELRELNKKRGVLERDSSYEDAMTKIKQEYEALVELAPKGEEGKFENSEGKKGYRAKPGIKDELVEETLQSKNKIYGELLKHQDELKDVNNQRDELIKFLKPREELYNAEKEYDALLETKYENSRGVTEFKLKEGATEEQFIAASDKKEKTFKQFKEVNSNELQTQMGDDLKKLEEPNKLEKLQRNAISEHNGIGEKRVALETAKENLDDVTKFKALDEAQKKESDIFKKIKDDLGTFKKQKIIKFAIGGAIVGAAAIIAAAIVDKKKHK